MDVPFDENVLDGVEGVVASSDENLSSGKRRRRARSKLAIRWLNVFDTQKQISTLVTQWCFFRSRLNVIIESMRFTFRVC